jgi:ribosome assembly protein RRB1
MLHNMQSQWPCLSFDVVPDKLGAVRSKFPVTATIVSGTQADKPSNNRICVMKAFDLHKTQHDDGL